MIVIESPSLSKSVVGRVKNAMLVPRTKADMRELRGRSAAGHGVHAVIRYAAGDYFTPGSGKGRLRRVPGTNIGVDAGDAVGAANAARYLVKAHNAKLGRYRR